ncbi:hypothetical protein [Azospirillum doebereinerae]
MRMSAGKMGIGPLIDANNNYSRIKAWRSSMPVPTAETAR